jgi:hypothetical protein
MQSMATTPESAQPKINDRLTARNKLKESFL